MLTTHVVNGDRPIFTYNATAPTEITEVSTQLFVDVNDAEQEPSEVNLQTAVFLRNQNRAPTAEFEWAPMPETNIFLNASASIDPEEKSLTFEWYDPDRGQVGWRGHRPHLLGARTRASRDEADGEGRHAVHNQHADDLRDRTGRDVPMMKKLLTGERGNVMVTSILLLSIMLSLGLAAASRVDTQTSQSRTERERESSFNLAEASLSAQTFILGRRGTGTAERGPVPGRMPQRGVPRTSSVPTRNS